MSTEKSDLTVTGVSDDKLVQLFQGIGLDAKKSQDTLKNKKLSATLAHAIHQVPNLNNVLENVLFFGFILIFLIFLG